MSRRRASAAGATDDPSDTVQRLDKWLWCARFYKTRNLAAEAIKNGRVQVNRGRGKPATTVRVGDAVTVRRAPFVFAVTVTGIVPQRVAAGIAATLYEETAASQSARETLAEQLRLDAANHSPRHGKLNKKERRERERFKSQRED